MNLLNKDCQRCKPNRNGEYLRLLMLAGSTPSVSMIDPEMTYPTKYIRLPEIIEAVTKYEKALSTFCLRIGDGCSHRSALR